MFKGRVLYWGGDEYMAELTCSVLERRDFEVVRAPTVEAFFARIAESKPHLVVIDQVQARGDSALAGCRRLRESFTSAEIPVVFLVRDDTESAILEVSECGADLCLAIPYKASELLAKATLLVRKTCREDGRRQAQRAIEKAMAGKRVDFSTGVPFGPYLLEEVLGRGSMGAVFRARPADGGEEVALKVLDHELQADGRALKRLEREGRILMRLRHPHIVKVRDVSSCEGFHIMAMEFVRGECLVNAVERRGPLPCGETAQVLLQVASALGAMWDAGLVHRDVKPDNLLLEPNGRAKVVDFGLARGKEDERVTRSGIIYGTPNYMSPEQIQGLELDFRSDIYSLGATAYFMLTGTPPFDGPNTRGILYRHVFEDLKPPERLNPGLTPGLGAVVCRMMAKEAGDRYRSLADLREALQNAAGECRPEAGGRGGHAPKKPGTRSRKKAGSGTA
ncbi:MAG: protein kinase [Planctomycetes bacterium]|nr:protein kinase [Planctomycetota bacterium]